MLFLLERLLNRLTTDWTFFWLALLPPLVYASFMAITPSLHTLSSTFAVPEDAPLAQTGNPTGVAPLSSLISSPINWTAFVKDNFSSQRILGYPRGYGQVISPAENNAIYLATLPNLRIKKENNNVTTTYTGSDDELGNRLVFYYSTTLFQRIQEGYKRQGSYLKSPLTDGPRMDPVTPPQRILWSRERTLPTLRWLIAGVMALLLVQIIRELLDTSYKSEKQIAEHTQLPILGCLPNLNSVPAPMDATQHLTHDPSKAGDSIVNRSKPS